MIARPHHAFGSVPSQKFGASIAVEAPGSRGATRAHIGDMQPRSNEASRDASAAREVANF
jgi:hypothetical protein